MIKYGWPSRISLAPLEYFVLKHAGLKLVVEDIRVDSKSMVFKGRKVILGYKTKQRVSFRIYDMQVYDQLVLPTFVRERIAEALTHR